MAGINAEIATAFCSIAEIYLTDLCDDEGAQAASTDCTHAPPRPTGAGST